VSIKDSTTPANGGVVAYFTDVSSITGSSAPSAEAKFESGKWGKAGEHYVDGYTYIYYGPASGGGAYKVTAADLEQNVVALQDKGSGSFFAAPGFKVTIKKSPLVRDKFLVSPPKVGPGNSPNWQEPVGPNGEKLETTLAGTGILGVDIEIDAATAAKIAAQYPGDDIQIYVYGRYNSESDFEGNYLGEVEINNSSLPTEVTL
jgi:hypothetical protein